MTPSCIARIGRFATLVFIGLALPAVAWGNWTGFYLGACGALLWVLNRKEPA